MIIKKLLYLFVFLLSVGCSKKPDVSRISDLVCKQMMYSYLFGQVQLNDSTERSKALAKELLKENPKNTKAKESFAAKEFERVAIFSEKLESEMRTSFSSMMKASESGSYEASKKLALEQAQKFGALAAEDRKDVFKECSDMMTPIILECSKVPEKEMQACMEHYKSKMEALNDKYIRRVRSGSQN